MRKRLFVRRAYWRKRLTSPIFPDEVFQPIEPEVGNEAADAEDDPAVHDESEPGSSDQS